MVTLYERYTATKSSGFNIYGVNYGCQTFTIGNTGDNVNHNISSVKVFVEKVGSPTALNAAIYAVDGDGKPTGAALSTGSLSGASIGLYDYYEITMTTYLLQANTQYALVLWVTGGDGSNKILWGYVNPGTYGGGKLWYSSDSGSSWNTLDYDFDFEEYGELPSSHGFLNLRVEYWGG